MCTGVVDSVTRGGGTKIIGSVSVFVNVSGLRCYGSGMGVPVFSFLFAVGKVSLRWGWFGWAGVRAVGLCVGS